MKSRQVWTAAIVTLGCKLNQAESYRLHQDLTAAGVEVRPFGEPVDLCVVNTCTVTQVADQQARQLLRRAARFSPGGFIVAVGCYAQVSPQEVAAVAGVDLVIASKGRLLEQLATSGLTPGGTHSAGLNANSGPGPRRPLPETRVRQFVKLQDGCDDYCTYCIVPFARGHSASRPADAIVAEVRRLVGRGCCEVVLTGVQIGAYGRDRYRLGAADLPLPGAPLAALVRRLLAETEIGRIRISSIQPQDWTDDFLDLFSNPRLCPHLHLPLQSGADVTLRRMARRYRSGDFARLVERIRGAIPDVALTADMIVGFPGESEEDHLESLSFATTMEFADAHVFRYSPRRGTAASRMADQIRPEVKQRRAEELRTAIAESATRFREHFLGTRARVLWEEELQPVQGPRRWTGLTGNYLRVESSSSSDLLGHETEVTLGRLDGESFVAAPAVMEVG
ncbi:MAG: tRNA (N(6)-L-threonylcarbamoyladenosine(37)-C(2))-methylthiotransferase MtaB [Chloroflexi bacterium]|nr:tRNA (N(6)-L-threonylcarbamoyladenosine(37)-C(2))-methylthiotransferase MtaB [Chloroflexota bacterium]